MRKKRNPIFVFGEGKSEKAFFEHLKEVFQVDIDRNNKAITASSGTGSSPAVILEDAIRIAANGSYNELFLVYDTDGTPPLNDTQIEAATEKGFTRILSSPYCFDCMLLKAKTGTNGNNCARCKTSLSAYVSKPTESYSYNTNFGKEFLEDYADNNPNEILTKIINIFRKQ